MLATRGMPQIMLEQTLNYLHDELTNAIPDNTETYEKLLTSAEILSKARTQLISKKAFESLSNEFDEFVGADLAKQLKNTGRLLVASVADEKNGLKGAVSALQEWIGDEARFPDKWISGVKHIISKSMAIASNPSR